MGPEVLSRGVLSSLKQIWLPLGMAPGAQAPLTHASHGAVLSAVKGARLGGAADGSGRPWGPRRNPEGTGSGPSFALTS